MAINLTNNYTLCLKNLILKIFYQEALGTYGCGIHG